VCDAAANPRDWSPVTDICKIGSFCFARGARDSTGCGICDPDKDASHWSAATDVCVIAGQCVASGATDPAGCGTCDPTKSTSAYTPDPGKCLISDACYATDDPSPSGCGRCDPAEAPLFWTPALAATATTTGFESGLSGYVVDAPVGGIGWQVAARRAHGGSSSLHFGDPTKGTLDDGQAHQGQAKSAGFALPAGQKAAVHLWIYLDVETSPNHDMFAISAGGQLLWAKSDKTVPAASYRTWYPVEIDLSAFAGQSVELTFSFDTVDAWANTGEGIFVDDVTVISACGAL
jgi:hypothetical protein